MASRFPSARLAAALCAAGLAACDGDVRGSAVSKPDAGAEGDAGQPDLGADAGPGDAGPEALDGGGEDAGPEDAGPADSGAADSGAADGGPADSGPIDSGPADSGPTDSGPVDAGPRPYPWSPAPTGAETAWLDAPPTCDPDDWLGKAFTYRLRLRGDGTAANPGFVSIGPDHGQSMVVGFRDPRTNCQNDWSMEGCTKLNVPNTRGKYGWGDGTIWLGWYLAHLASEYAALTSLGVDTAQTRQELYYALMAFNRVDKTAETNYGLPEALNGFFQRDDVPPTFIWKDAAHTLFRFPRDDGYLGYGCVGSTAACGALSIADGSYESQDQVIGMLMGLALVHKLVPQSATYNSVGLRQEARAITHRMVKFLRDHNWKIVDPNGNSPPNEWGGSAAPFSDQIAKAANIIAAPDFGITDYRDWISGTEGVAAWAGIDTSWFTQSAINKVLALRLAAITDQWDPDKLATRSGDYGAPGFALANAVLYGRAMDPEISNNEIESMLSTAPCGGPCYRTPGCEEAPGWKGPLRWSLADDRNGNGLGGEYNGVDYTLLHNLYLVARGGRYTVSWAPRLCRGGGPLTAMLSGTPVEGATYDPWSYCAASDFGIRFCGRPFAAWLDAAYKGEATIFMGPMRWTCAGREPCVLHASGGTGTGGADLFLGTPSADTFSGGTGNDCLYGMGGGDTLKGEAGRDEIHGGLGDDTICGETCSLSDVNGDPDQLFGEEGADHLMGGPGTDDLYGGPHNDWLEGGLGPDFIEGAAGDDKLEGGDGVDYMDGGEGNDVMYGNLGADHLIGGPGRNKLDGGWGDDFLGGGDEADFLKGNDGDDTLWGGGGSDRLCGGCGKDWLNAQWDSDACRDKMSFLYCISDPAGTMLECEDTSSLSAKDCTDSAFEDW